jgi:four helix bundle protein
MAHPGIDDRADAFLHDVVVFTGTIIPVPGTRRVIEQVVAAAGSISANRQEATSASSKKEFIRFNEIALRSAKECAVWLKACHAGKWGQQHACERLLDEANQIARILGAIVVSAKRGGSDNSRSH